MLIVLAAMAVVAGLAIPAYFGKHGITLDNGARLLARDLRVAQNMASFEGQPCTFVLGKLRSIQLSYGGVGGPS